MTNAASGAVVPLAGKLAEQAMEKRSGSAVAKVLAAAGGGKAVQAGVQSVVRSRFEEATGRYLQYEVRVITTTGKENSQVGNLKFERVRAWLQQILTYEEAHCPGC